MEKGERRQREIRETREEVWARLSEEKRQEYIDATKRKVAIVMVLATPLMGLFTMAMGEGWWPGLLMAAVLGVAFYFVLPPVAAPNEARKDQQ